MPMNGSGEAVLQISQWIRLALPCQCQKIGRCFGVSRCDLHRGRVSYEEGNSDPVDMCTGGFVRRYDLVKGFFAGRSGGSVRRCGMRVLRNLRDLRDPDLRESGPLFPRGQL